MGRMQCHDTHSHTHTFFLRLAQGLCWVFGTRLSIKTEIRKEVVEYLVGWRGKVLDLSRSLSQTQQDACLTSHGQVLGYTTRILTVLSG